MDDFVRDENGKVTGILARGEGGEHDELLADVVIVAEGANSMLAEKKRPAAQDDRRKPSGGRSRKLSSWAGKRSWTGSTWRTTRARPTSISVTRCWG